MEELHDYLQRARQLDRGAFVMAHRYLFFLKHAKAPEPRFDAMSDLLDGPTMSGKFTFDPAADRMQIAAIQKKPGNAEHWVFSIGRAATCDVVLRFPIVSQLHAHLTVDASGKIAIIDAGSANSTRCNGKRLLPNQVEALQIGDALSFGPLKLELCDAERLHRLLSSPLAMNIRPLPTRRPRSG